MINRFIKVQCESASGRRRMRRRRRSCCWGVVCFVVVPRIWVSFSCHTAPINTHTDSGASLDLWVPCAVILADAATLQPTQKWQLECAQCNFSNEIYAATSLPLPAILPVSSAYVQINLIANKVARSQAEQGGGGEGMPVSGSGFSAP